MTRRAGCSSSLLRMTAAAARPYCMSSAPEQAASSVRFLCAAQPHTRRSGRYVADRHIREDSKTQQDNKRVFETGRRASTATVEGIPLPPPARAAPPLYPHPPSHPPTHPPSHPPTNQAANQQHMPKRSTVTPQPTPFISTTTTVSARHPFTLLQGAL